VKGREIREDGLVSGNSTGHAPPPGGGTSRIDRTDGSDTDVRRRTLERLTTLEEKHHVLLGFDGFVDDICHVMDVRNDRHSLRRIETMRDFGERVAGSAGLSCALQLESREFRPGGNALNMGRAVLEFGNELSLIATLGDDEILPIFRGLTDSCRDVTTIGEPGRTEALEFLDGKLMLNRIDGFHVIGWDLLCSRVGRKHLSELADSACLIGLLDWTIFPLMDGIVEGFLEMINESGRRPIVFIDLSDLRRRTLRDVAAMAATVARCGTTTETIVSFNESESLIAAEALSIAQGDPEERARAIRDRLEIEAVVIHPLRGAAVATARGTCWIDGPYTASPAVSTGGGDTFNAGFCNGWLSGMAPDECAIVGAYSSGYFVRWGKPPGKKELTDFIQTSVPHNVDGA
jgi:sugar/nucleoside kinase (ribokinase family)